MNLNSILTQFRKFFPTQWINSLAKQTGAVQRASSRLTGKDICQLLIQAVNEPADLSLNSFCKSLYKISGRAKLKAQSLWERIVNQKTVDFMEKIYAQVWSLYSEEIKENLVEKSCSLFGNFSSILIEDTSIVSLNQKLFPNFKGTGGSASKSCVKIHLIFDAISHKFKRLNIFKDGRTDNTLIDDVLELITEGSLLIRDLGFFATKAFKKILEKKAYFLSRLHPGVGIFLKAEDKQPIDIIKYLKTTYKTFSHGSLKVFLSEKEKLAVRLVFYRAPEDIVNARKRKVKKSRQKNGGTASEKLLLWQEYTIFITNISEEILPTSLVGTLYRLRWDIELIFKTWKSHLCLDILKGTRPERIEVFLYAKLIGILLLGMICDYIRNKFSKLFANKEISETKIAKFLVEMNILRGLFVGYLNRKTIEFLDDAYWVKLFYKQKRSRKTTRERIRAQESFGMTTS